MTKSHEWIIESHGDGTGLFSDGPKQHPAINRLMELEDQGWTILSVDYVDYYTMCIVAFK